MSRPEFADDAERAQLIRALDDLVQAHFIHVPRRNTPASAARAEAAIKEKDQALHRAQMLLLRLDAAPPTNTAR